MRGGNFIKFHKAVKLINRRQGASVSELMDELGIDRSNVYRLIDTIGGMGFPVYQKETDLPEKSKVRFHFTDPVEAPALRIAWDEYLALNYIRGYARLFKGTDIEKDIENAIRKIGLSLAPKYHERCDQLGTLLVPAIKFRKDYSDMGEVIDSLTESILARRVCRLTYHSFTEDEVKTYPIHPLHFFEHAGGLYLYSFIPRYEHVRILAVERIQAIEITDGTFSYPDGFDPEKRLEDAFTIYDDDPVEVAIRFSELQARYIRERIWAKGQKIRENKDGSIVLEMSTSGRWDVMRWVLGFGEDAEILEPSDLRAEIKERVGRAATLYDNR